MAHVLALLHLPTSNPGLVGALLEAAGHRLTLCRPLHGDALPSIEGMDATVVFGGPQHANDPSLIPEVNWIQQALAHRHPLFGICLGGQLIAKALGGSVTAHPEGRVEVGYAPVEALPGQSWMTGQRMVYHWHRDGFSVPPGATPIARGGPHFPHQAFAYQASLAFQFHPEITSPIMEHWLARDHGDLALPGAEPNASRHRGDHARYAQGNADWLHGVLQRWLPTGALY